MTRSHPLRSLSMHCARQPLSVSLQSGGGGHTPRPSGEGGHTPRPSCTFEELKYIYIYYADSGGKFDCISVQYILLSEGHISMTVRAEYLTE